MTIADDLAEVRAALKTLLDADDALLILLRDETAAELAVARFKVGVLKAHLERIDAAESIGNFLEAASRPPP